jgi:RNA polymerase sigma factor (sigma-70 family)
VEAFGKMADKRAATRRNDRMARTYTRPVAGPPTEDLVARVLGAGEDAPAAWDALVRRFSDLVWKVLRSFDLSDADRWDAYQATWLRALEKLCTLRDPSRFGGWLATVARNEVHSSLLRHNARVKPADMQDLETPSTDGDVDRQVLRAELIQAVRAGFAELDPECQRLLRLVVSDPPLNYREMEAVLQRPHGSIGPTRGRCLDKLRRTSALLALYHESGSTREER